MILGAGTTVTVINDDPAQAPFTPITVYSWVEEGVTICDAPLPFVGNHVYDEAELFAVNVTVSPAQILALLADRLIVLKLDTGIAMILELAQPEGSVPVTV